MPFEVYKTTAEHVIGATDAALQKPDGVDQQIVAGFLDTTVDNAHNALIMAEQLSLLKQVQAGHFITCSPCSIYLCTSVRENKAAVLRYVLEQYPPYKTFKIRLALNGLAGEAANQTRAIYEIDAHREVIVGTFTDLGTYAQSLISEGAGLYKPAESEPEKYLTIVNQAIHDRESTELFIRKRIGAQAADWVDAEQVMSNLVTAYQRAATAIEDPRAPIVHSANSIESFLTQLANHLNINIQGATGINAKAERLAQENQLTAKHKFMVKYLGHIRNAAEHGVDQEIGRQWQVSPNTAVEYVHVTLTVITDLVAGLSGDFIV